MTAKWCAPNREDNRLTCYTIEQLKKIAREYNSNCPKCKKIRINGRSKHQLWNDIREALSDRCKNEICWIDQDFVRKTGNREILKETFRPKMPKVWEKENYTTWLNTDDINFVMKQYEKKHKDFLFVGPIPIDCGIENELRCQLTNFNINKLYKNGIRKIGIIYNTGESWTSGYHWFGVLIDLNRNRFEYYDSYASKPPREVMDLYEKISEELKSGNNMNIKFDRNRVRKQYDNFSCGVYSMNFIIERLGGKTLSQLEKMKLDTDKMQQLKKKWYRNH